MPSKRTRILVALLSVLVLGACEGVSREPADSEGAAERVQNPEGRLFGNIELIGPGSRDEPGMTGIGVNAYLWRASLDTISFLPLSSADPFGGVIITDWYAPPESPSERFKATVYILGRELRSDGVRVSVFRQERGESGEWQDSLVAQDTATNLENAILARARELRIASIEG